MFKSSNTLFVTLYGKADALGDLTTTNASTQTLVAAGTTVGFAAATAVAKGTTAAPPLTHAMTDWFGEERSITSSHTSDKSIDFPYGPTPVSSSFSLTAVSTHDVGGLWSGHSWSGLTGHSVYGLF